MIRRVGVALSAALLTALASATVVLTASAQPGGAGLPPATTASAGFPDSLGVPGAHGGGSAPVPSTGIPPDARLAVWCGALVLIAAGLLLVLRQRR
jgi:hypothetical protein